MRRKNPELAGGCTNLIVVKLTWMCGQHQYGQLAIRYAPSSSHQMPKCRLVGNWLDSGGPRPRLLLPPFSPPAAACQFGAHWPRGHIDSRGGGKAGSRWVGESQRAEQQQQPKTAGHGGSISRLPHSPLNSGPGNGRMRRKRSRLATAFPPPKVPR